MEDLIATLLLIAGICLAGSDGDWFPWVNFTGMAMAFLAGSIVLKGANLEDKAFENLKENLAHHYRMISHLQKKYRAETGRDFCTAGIGKIEIPEHRLSCERWSPDEATELEVYYICDQNGVDIHDVLIHGGETSELVFDGLLAAYEYLWKAEFEAMLKKQADEIATDKAGENFETERLMERISK